MLGMLASTSTYITRAIPEPKRANLIISKMQSADEQRQKTREGTVKLGLLFL
jgi:hypothetical protein